MLRDEQAGLHPFVLGEIALGNLRKRAETLDYLSCLPSLAIALETEVHHLLDSHRLWGSGLVWVDLHILASAKLAGWRIYSADRTMNGIAGRFDLDHVRA